MLYNQGGYANSIHFKTHGFESVSYTHLDVYKRQLPYRRSTNESQDSVYPYSAPPEQKFQ